MMMAEADDEPLVMESDGRRLVRGRVVLANTSPWVCPVCGRVYGPTALECGPCNRKIDMKQLRGE